MSTNFVSDPTKSCQQRPDYFCPLKFGNIYCLKLFRGSEIDIIYILRQRWSEIIGTTTKNGIVLVATSN